MFVWSGSCFFLTTILILEIFQFCQLYISAVCATRGIDSIVGFSPGGVFENSVPLFQEGVMARQQKALADKRRRELTQKCSENHMARVFGKQAGMNISLYTPYVNNLNITCLS